MTNDLISREAAIAAVERREKYLVGDKRVDVESIKNFLANRPAVDAVEVVRCKDCKRRGMSSCPMCHEEYFYDEDDGGDYYTFDNTTDDGYCHCGAKMDLEG